MHTEIVTDTATIAVFDPAALSHKIEADGDWWTYECEELLAELRNQNLYLINTGSDGKVAVAVSTIPQQAGTPLRCRSGVLYITCGEEIPGGGLMPELIRGGLRYSAPAGVVLVAHTQKQATITIHIWSEQDGSANRSQPVVPCSNETPPAAGSGG